jgi:hypothetical protein
MGLFCFQKKTQDAGYDEKAVEINLMSCCDFASAGTLGIKNMIFWNN